MKFAKSMYVWLKVDYSDKAPERDAEPEGERPPEELVETLFTIEPEDREKFTIRFVPPEEMIPEKPIATIEDLLADHKTPLLNTLRDKLLFRNKGMRITEIAELSIFPEDEIKNIDVPDGGLRLVLLLCKKRVYDSILNAFSLKTGEIIGNIYIYGDFNMDVCDKSLYLFSRGGITEVHFKLRKSPIPHTKLKGKFKVKYLRSGWTNEPTMAAVVDKTTSPQTFVCLVESFEIKPTTTLRRLSRLPVEAASSTYPSTSRQELTAAADARNALLSKSKKGTPRLHVQTLFLTRVWKFPFSLAGDQMYDLEAAVPEPQSVCGVAIDSKGQIWVNFSDFIGIFSPDFTLLQTFCDQTEGNIYPARNGDVHIRCLLPSDAESESDEVVHAERKENEKSDSDDENSNSDDDTSDSDGDSSDVNDKLARSGSGEDSDWERDENPVTR